MTIEQASTCAPEINAVTPQRLDDVIGNPLVREQVAVTVAACRFDRRPFPHTLVCSQGPGQGKTTLSRVIANEMGTGEFREVLGQTITSVGTLNGILLDLDPGSTLLIDEVHTLDPTEGQHALLRVLEDGKVFLNSGKKAKAIDLPAVTVICATTEEYGIIEPLRNRFRLNLRLSFLNDDEIAQMLRVRTQGLGWSVEDAVFPMVATRSRGTPREALKLMESVWRTSRAAESHVIRVEDVERTLRLEGLDARGLKAVDRDYLRVIHEAGGPVRLNVLSTRLGLPNQTIQKLVETFLIRDGLIAKSEQGRELTHAGLDHVRATTNR
jgi:Holliday junction DNA helicase RuvB